MALEQSALLALVEALSTADEGTLMRRLRANPVSDDTIRVLRRDRLGGLVHEYAQAA